MNPKMADGLRAISIAALTIGILIFLAKLSRQMESLTSSLGQTIAKTNALLDRTDAIEGKVSDAVSRISSQSMTQESEWRKSQLEFYKTIADAKEILVRTNKSLNDVLVPRAAQSLDQSTALQIAAMKSIVATTERIDGAIDALQPAIHNSVDATAAAAAAGEAAAKDLADPSIHETEAHLDGVAGNLDASSGDIRAFVHRETTPVRGTWNLIKHFLMEFAGPSAQVATAVK